MRQIIISFSLLAILAGLTLGITGAYFNDTATSAGNSFVSGTLDLKLSSDNSAYSDSVEGTFNAADMTPGGAEVSGTVWLKNSGSVPADHIRVISVENTPSDNGINEPECKAYGGNWKSGFGQGWTCVLPASLVSDSSTCTGNYGGSWGDTGDGYHCYAKEGDGFKDNISGWNDIDKYLEVTSVKYAGAEKMPAYSSSAACAGEHYDYNGNGYYDLDDLERGPWTKDGCALDNLRPAPGVSGSDPHTFVMKVRLSANADNHYQTDKDGLKITFQMNQSASQ